MHKSWNVIYSYLFTDNSAFALNNNRQLYLLKLLSENTNESITMRFDVISQGNQGDLRNQLVLNLSVKRDHCKSSSSSSYCTVVIVLLASLSLILLTTLGILIIIIVRKKPSKLLNFIYSNSKDTDSQISLDSTIVR